MKNRTTKKESKYLTESKFQVFENKFQVFEKNFEKHMANVAKSFSRIDEKFDKIDQRLVQHEKAFALVLKQMQTFTKEAREHRQTMSSLMRTDIGQEKAIEDLQIRVDRLEMQIK